MKLPLEPIPTEQMVVVKQDTSRTNMRRRPHEDTAAMAVDPSLGQSNRVYPWLLGASTCLSAVLCWMYVTKPVITQASESEYDVSSSADVAGDYHETNGQAKSTAAMANPEAVEPPAELVPSDNGLPGGEPTKKTPVAKSSDPTNGADGQGPRTPQAIAPDQLVAGHLGKGEPGVGLGWESTNLKVQHILSADSGNGELEKIVINVPVLYETRTMRWAPDDIAKARRVMARLMVYERNMNNMRREGQAIMKEWNELLEGSVPALALRADSPSLPYNHSQGGHSGGLPGGSSIIKVEQ